MPRSKSKEKMVLISMHLPKQLLDEIDTLVMLGIFPSRSEVIRIAIWNLIRDKKIRELMNGR